MEEGSRGRERRDRGVGWRRDQGVGRGGRDRGVVMWRFYWGV